MEAGGGITIPRRHLISDEKHESPNLRDYLRIRQDENLDNRNNFRPNMSNLTLSAVLKTEDRSGGPMRTPSNRTLMDIIREDPNGGGYSKDTRKSWRHFREKLRLRRQGSGSSWTSSVPVPASDVPIQHPMGSSSSRRMMMSRRDSTRLNTPTPDQTSQPDADLSSGVPRSRSSMLQRNESRAIRGRYDNARGIDDEMGAEEGEETEGETTEEEEGGGGGTGGGEEQPVRMSLMALLAETDRQMGLDGSGFTMDDDEDADEEEEEEEEGGAGGGGYNNCCVCMVRHKGAAFIPCGHTFCRLCSRELWVQRGNCPLCNNFILEILDIF